MSNEKKNTTNKKAPLKQELIDILVTEYGYEKADLKNNPKTEKPYTNAELKDMIKNEEREQAKSDVKEELGLMTDINETIDDNALIPVMSGVFGGLVHRSDATGQAWRFADFGQIDNIPYSELKRLHNLKPKVFKEAWLVILNDQIAEQFGYKEIYKNILTPQNIDSVFEQSADEIGKFLDNLPEGMKPTFFNRARGLYENNRLDSLAIINVIQNKLGVSLDDNNPIHEIVEHKK